MRALDKDKMTDLAAALAAGGYRVVAPLRDGAVVRLRQWQGGATIDMEGFAVNSVKEFLMPPSEPIARYAIEGNDFRDEEAAPDVTKTVVLGVRPCDAASLALLDTVFNWDFKDAFYNARRAACTLVTMVCTAADAECFCTSVGGRPDQTQGADAVLRPAGGGTKFLLEPLTDKGRAIAAAGVGVLAEAAGLQADPPADVPPQFDHQAVTQWLALNFDSPLWKELSLACQGCGTCAFACPSCHCFDIQDEATRSRAVRYRNWDTCARGLFTLHASGHNPRPSQAARWRQRVMHKFSYIPQRFNLLGCSGCGRCGRLCPSGVAIVETCRKIDQLCKAEAAPK